MDTALSAVAVAVAPEPTITIDLPRFGSCTFRESDVFTFPWGLPGFTALRRFLMLSAAEDDGYFWLQSLDEPSVALPLCDPWSVFAEYEAPLPSYAKQSLALESADSFCVLCVLVGNARTGETTINLLAPVILNLQSRVGRQITLENARYDVRTPLGHAKIPL